MERMKLDLGQVGYEAYDASAISHSRRSACAERRCGRFRNRLFWRQRANVDSPLNRGRVVGLVPMSRNHLPISRP